eukprot:scaffold33734_cov36-Prasinocladus_malaysianus.AAC.2
MQTTAAHDIINITMPARKLEQAVNYSLNRTCVDLESYHHGRRSPNWIDVPDADNITPDSTPLAMNSRPDQPTLRVTFWQVFAPERSAAGCCLLSMLYPRGFNRNGPM